MNPQDNKGFGPDMPGGNPPGTASASPFAAAGSLRRDPFWQIIPAWREIDERTFLDFRWQEHNSIVNAADLSELIRSITPAEVIADLEQGFRKSPMAVRVSPYLLSLIDWTDPYRDPIRCQFLPLGSQFEPDHPMSSLDPLFEQHDSPVHGLTCRYPGKALFLALDTCPVYCRCCTRSYAVGLDTKEVSKISLSADGKRWDAILSYISQRTDLEDIVVSGGDAYRLSPDQLRALGHRLLDIAHIRRFRFGAKGPVVQPMKILTHHAWVDALTEVVERGRKLSKEVSLHTHFNHPGEITGITQDAMAVLFERGITVRNQSVLQRGVNETPETMIELCRRLAAINVHPYYAYVHDLTPGTEDLRTAIGAAIAAEKRVRGTIAGFNTPTFIVDLPGGGGKRDVHSFEYYNRETGVSIYAAPSVKPDRLFPFFDPLRDLAPAIQRAWRDPAKRIEMIQEAVSAAR